MPSQSLLQIVGSRGSKEAQYAPIFTDRFFVGLWTNRNPLRSPLSTFYADGWHLGGTDALIGGTNIELSPRLTLCRRPGQLAYSTATIPGVPDTFYTFRQFGSTFQVIVDTSTNIYTLTPTAATSIFTKGAMAGQTNFLGVGETLYFGDGVEQMAWQNNAIRNWGISIGLFSNSVGPTIAGSGANGGSPGTAWTNPNNVTSPTNYATVVLAASGGATSGGASSQADNATDFGFSISTSEVITGVQVSFQAFYTLNSGTILFAPQMEVQLLKNGAPVGTAKLSALTTTSATYTLGIASDLWGTSVGPNDVNQASFGFAFTGGVTCPTHSSINATIELRNVNITLYGTGGPTVTPTGSGSFVAYSGYEYVVAYGNSASGQVSSATPASANTGPLGAGISTSTLVAAGTGYAVDDTGIVVAGNYNATYKILTVSSGAVLTYSITAAGGGYSVANNVGTTPSGSQPGSGSGFTINITALTGYAGIQVDLVASTDPQVNQIWVFRTADGGSTFLNIPTSPYPNTTQNITDSAPDSELDILEQAPIDMQNNPPPTGSLDPVLYLGLVWVHVGNAVYFTRAASAVVGVTYESFPPANVFTFPETVIRKIPINSGLLIFTTSNIYIIAGQNTSSSILYSAPFLSGYGVVSWNAVWLDGSIIYFFTSDNRLISLDPSSGVQDMGFPIGDQLAGFNSANVYVTYHSATSNDVALYVGDGSTGWFRCNPNQAPDGAITGPVWSPKASIVGGCGALVGMETAPGVHQLMMGGTSSNESVLVRDSSYSTFTDNGSAYEANFTVGSIVLAQPGQIAHMRFVSAFFIRTGTAPTVSVLLGEISGTFESISGYVVAEPPYLVPSTSLFNNRYYFKQTVNGGYPGPALCQHMQIQISYGTDQVQNELLSLTINGKHESEK